MSEEQKDLRDSVTRMVEFGQTLSTEITTDLAMGKWNLRDSMTLKQKYAEEIHEKYPQISVESVLRLLMIGVDPGVEHATMSIGGKMFSITPELKEGDNLFDHLAPDDGSYGLSYFSNPDRSDVTMDWSGTFLDPKRRIGGGFNRGELALVVAGSPYQPLSDRMLANKHQVFWDEEYYPQDISPTVRKMLTNGRSGLSQPFGGHAAKEGITYFVPRDYQMPMIDSITDMGTRKIQNASLSGMRHRNIGSIGHVHRPLPYTSHDGYAMTAGYLRMNALTLRLGFTHAVADPVISLRYNREYGHSHFTVIAPVNAGEFYDSRIPHYRRPAFAIDIESNIASRALLPKVASRNKGPKKRRHK